MTFNEKMVLKNYDSYVKLVAEAYKEAPDFEESEKYRWDILNKSNYTFFKRLTSKVDVIFVSTDKSKDGNKIEILSKTHNVEFMAGDPYASQKEMRDAYMKDKRLYISMDYSEHPVFSVTDNIVFRTVHDYIVHILANVDFSGKGEIAAFNAHAKLAPNEAIPAIFTEVVGQASHFVYFGEFPKQKITVLKGFDYENVGAVEGYDIINKEFVKRENIKKFNELYDSEESKKKISKDELKKMVAMDYEHSFEPGKWHGKNSADLNIGINDLKYGPKYTKFDRHGILDVMYKKAINIVPELKKFTLQEGNLKGERAFVFNREVILNVDNLDDNYSIKMNLWVDYYFTDDDIFDDRKEGTISVLFAPQITTTRISAGLEDIGGIKTTKKCDGGSCEDGIDISDDEVTRVMFKLDKLLSGAPDKEDKEKRKEFYLSKDGLSMEGYENTLREVRNILKRFETYVYGKYGIKIL